MFPTLLALQDTHQSLRPLVGGKAASLGELAKLEGVRVPTGFVVTTQVFQQVVAQAPTVREGLARLAQVQAKDPEGIRAISAQLRQAIEALPIPPHLEVAIAQALSALGEAKAYAVRSSATAEDLPTASFAGQQDSYLNLRGLPAILAHLSRCWASLFSDRAVAYRQYQGFDHASVQLAVLVQQMVPAEASGVLFTADPLNGHRHVSAINAVAGLGDALVSGRVNPDTYRVREGRILEQQSGRGSGGFVLSEAQVLGLEALGRRIQAHFSAPQDIEWCLAEGAFHVVQSRAITTLFPLPEGQDGTKRVYVSVGHQQMMTDAFKPLGLSLWQLTALRPMPSAGGRVFVDISAQLATPGAREAVVAALGQSDPLIGDALNTLVARGFIDEAPPAPPQGTPAPAPAPAPAPSPVAIEPTPALAATLIAERQAAIAQLKTDIEGNTGTDLLDFILEDLQRLKRFLVDPRSSALVMGALNTTFWLNDNLEAWLGVKKAADTLSLSVPGNVTSEMGLALMDLADLLRPYPQLVAHLQQVGEGPFLGGLSHLEGGPEFRAALEAFLERYGMRCVGEFDLTRPRWAEAPEHLIPMLLSNLQSFAPQASRRKFEKGRLEAQAAEAGLLARLKGLPDGDQKAQETQAMIAQLRSILGYREHPKYFIVSWYFVYKQALMREAASLVQAGVLQAPEDLFYLSLPELREAVQRQQVAPGLIQARKAEHAFHQKLTPPRVFTSEGEVITGRYRREGLPPGALVGLGVSSGVVEGRARVLTQLEGARMEAGDILVTPFTDPSATPLFVAIQGLVTEVGGLMTHGAVVAREYGLPAVVGVEQATTRIRDGQRIRVHGTEGYVELLTD